MHQYIGETCPVCKEVFVEKDDVVICPECGAPHHRTCFRQLGRCALEDRHGTEHTWQKKEPDPEPVDSVVCPQCKTTNPSQNIFCEACGSPLNKAVGGATQYQNPMQGMPINFSAMFNPYGGLNPNEEIDGVTVSDLSLCVGENATYYLPKFKALSEKKFKISWNWAGCFGNFLYYFNRKMYAFGIPMMIIFLLYYVPSLYYSGQLTVAMMAQGTSVFTDIPANLVPLSNYLYYMQYIQMAIMILNGIFSNYIYKMHVCGKIEKVKEAYPAGQEYKEALKAKGGVNRRVVQVFVLLYLLSSFGYVLYTSIM